MKKSLSRNLAFCLISISILSLPAFASKGGTSSGGGDARVCGTAFASIAAGLTVEIDKSPYAPSKYDGTVELADVSISQPFPLDINGKRYALNQLLTSADPTLYGSTPATQFTQAQSQLKQYLQTFFPEAYVALNQLHFVVSKKKLPKLNTGYSGDKSSFKDFFEDCRKNQLAVQDFETGQVFVYKPIYDQLTGFEQALLEVHEAYVRLGFQKLGHPNPTKQEFIDLETAARKQVSSLVLDDPKKFLNAMGTYWVDDGSKKIKVHCDHIVPLGKTSLPGLENATNFDIVIDRKSGGSGTFDAPNLGDSSWTVSDSSGTPLFVWDSSASDMALYEAGDIRAVHSHDSQNPHSKVLNGTQIFANFHTAPYILTGIIRPAQTDRQYLGIADFEYLGADDWNVKEAHFQANTSDCVYQSE